VTGPEFMGYVCVAGAVALFMFVGIDLFTKRWKSYEESYVEGAGQTLDAMYLTIPPSHVWYLSFLSILLMTLLIFGVVGSLSAAIPCGILAFPLPKIIIHVLKKRRDKKFGMQFVDALASISNSLRAGFTMVQAFDLIQREMENPIKQEFRLMIMETRLGVPLDEALQHLARRMPSQDMDLFVTAVSILREVGGSLTEVFGNIAATIRERHRIEGKVDALTATGRIQGIMMVFLPIGFVIGINIISPNMLKKLYTHPVGLAVIGASVIMIAIGGLVIRKIVNIEV